MSSDDTAEFGALPSFPLHRNSTSSHANNFVLKSLPEDLQPASQCLAGTRRPRFKRQCSKWHVSFPFCCGLGGGNPQAHPDSCLQPPEPAPCSPLPFPTESNPRTLSLTHPRWHVAFARCGCQRSRRSGCI